MTSVEPDCEAAGARPFSGSPAKYRRFAVWGSVAFHAYLLVGYWAIKRYLVGEPWPTNWWPVLGGVASAALFARFAYRWIMRLDAQYGLGSGWVLQSTTIKLPRENPARRYKRTP